MKRFELVKTSNHPPRWGVYSHLTKKCHFPIGGKCNKKAAQSLLKGLTRLARKEII